MLVSLDLPIVSLKAMLSQNRSVDPGFGDSIARLSELRAIPFTSIYSISRLCVLYFGVCAPPTNE